MPFSPIAFAKSIVLSVQEYSELAWQSLANLFAHPRYVADTMQQADIIGVGSLPIVVLTGFFTGAVLALQSSNSLSRFGMVGATGQLVALSMVRELGPVLTGLMVAGRSATGMASELGSMKVTEQIDAMRALGTDPTKKLITPRVISATVMLFFLTIISDVVAMFGGSLIGVLLLHLDPHQYWTSSWQSLSFGDVMMGLTKPVFFGFIISSVGCYYGMSARGGTQGVGRATTQAMVAASVMIIVVDLFVTKLLMAFFPFK
ncbi:MAG TPA: ABC transporter permease [Candidatus Acidoferrales bacterium]|nr:ABC transporter permease [Candidatus Acidoferrales bacterium]